MKHPARKRPREKYSPYFCNSRVKNLVTGDFRLIRKNDPYAVCRQGKAVALTNRPGKTHRRIHGRPVLQEKGGTSDTVRRMRRPDPVCARQAGPMRFRRSENELPPLSRSLLPAGHAGKDETRHAFLGAAHAALLSPKGDRSLARGDIRTMIVCHGPADKP